MDPLARIPTRWLLVGAALACLALWAAPSSAQTATPDPVRGKLLFADAPNVQGVPDGITRACQNCHNGVENRRAAISHASAFADVSFDKAIERFGVAINGNFGGADGMGQYSQLDAADIRNIAAYLADTTKLTADGLSDTGVLAFTASAVGSPVTKTLTVKHGTTAPENLQIKSVALAAGGTTAFTFGTGCNNVTRAPAGTCSFAVTYTPTSTSEEGRDLTVTLQQGSSVFTRVVRLDASVATAPGTSNGGGGGGGGALGLTWLAGLALATITLARRKRG
jgi:cytochrome c553